MLVKKLENLESLVNKSYNLREKMAAPQNPFILPLPQTATAVPPPVNRILLANLVPGEFYTVINRHGPTQELRPTFTGSFVEAGTTQPNNEATARFNNLNYPNHPPNHPPVPPAQSRTVMDNDWYYVPMAAPGAPTPASRRGGKRTKVQRKKRKSKKSRKTCRK